jgi:hypothetical protein
LQEYIWRRTGNEPKYWDIFTSLITLLCISLWHWKIYRTCGYVFYHYCLGNWPC